MTLEEVIKRYFEFEREDVIFLGGGQREPDNYVKCPCCRRYIEIREVIR